MPFADDEGIVGGHLRPKRMAFVCRTRQKEKLPCQDFPPVCFF